MYILKWIYFYSFQMRRGGIKSYEICNNLEPKYSIYIILLGHQIMKSQYSSYVCTFFTFYVHQIPSNIYSTILNTSYIYILTFMYLCLLIFSLPSIYVNMYTRIYWLLCTYILHSWKWKFIQCFHLTSQWKF